MYQFSAVLVTYATIVRHSLYSSWQKAVEEEDSRESVDRLVQQFSIPLQSAGAGTGAFHGEFQELLQYATTYIHITLHIRVPCCVVASLSYSLCV